MIETKEQYEIMWVLLPHMNFTDEGPTHFDIINTIEALREVARAGELYFRLKKQSMGMPMPNKYRIAYEEAFDALPDWLIE